MHELGGNPTILYSSVARETAIAGTGVKNPFIIRTKCNGMIKNIEFHDYFSIKRATQFMIYSESKALGINYN